MTCKFTGSGFVCSKNNGLDLFNNERSKLLDNFNSDRGKKCNSCRWLRKDKSWKWFCMQGESCRHLDEIKKFGG